MKIVTRVLSLLPLVLAMMSTPSLAANVYSYGGTGTYIAIDGEVVKGDLGKLAAIYERIRGGEGTALIVDFNSPGGDLNEAMAMGRWIRHAKATTGVRPRSSCASACVYIFAAGVDKCPRGRSSYTGLT